MMALKRSGQCIVVLAVLQILGPGAACAQQPGSPAFDTEFEKQEAIYRSRGENVPAGYVVDRSLLSYASVLHGEFDRLLADLGPTDRWLDIGAGEGRAILDYYAPRFDAMHPEGRERRGKKAQAVAISIEDRRTPRWHAAAASLDPGQMRYLAGRRLREYSLEELGQFHLISDHIGGFSYSRNLSVFMEKALGFLRLNGDFFTLLLDVRTEAGTNPDLYQDALLLTEIEKADGSGVKVCSWLKSISCVQVACEMDTQVKRPVELYRIRKICNDVAVPSLELIHYSAGTPPQRRFRLASPPPLKRKEEG